MNSRISPITSTTCSRCSTCASRRSSSSSPSSRRPSPCSSPRATRSACRSSGWVESADRAAGSARAAPPGAGAPGAAAEPDQAEPPPFPPGARRREGLVHCGEDDRPGQAVRARLEWTMEEAMIGASANAYRTVQVTTASPAQLVVQLFEGAARFIEQGIQAIVAQLRASLDREVGPLADQLDGLYDYFFRRLVLANVEKDAAPAREVLGYIRELLAAWREVARQGLTGPEPVPVDVRT